VPADGAMLVVEVPADATVYVNGTKTNSQGAVRRYLSRGLTAGQKYEFVVRMATDAGKESTKVVSLTAGQRSSVSFKAAIEAPKTSVTLRVPVMTRDQVFDWAEAQNARYEFDGFQPVAMTGGSVNHAIIQANLIRHLGNRLGGGPCRSPLRPERGAGRAGRCAGRLCPEPPARSPCRRRLFWRLLLSQLRRPGGPTPARCRPVARRGAGCGLPPR
jgi:uncharacterized protein (TIGR03000 family)